MIIAGGSRVNTGWPSKAGPGFLNRIEKNEGTKNYTSNLSVQRYSNYGVVPSSVTRGESPCVALEPSGRYSSGVWYYYQPFR